VLHANNSTQWSHNTTTPQHHNTTTRTSSLCKMKLRPEGPPGIITPTRSGVVKLVDTVEKRVVTLPNKGPEGDSWAPFAVEGKAAPW
jgi:hypothetical protein